MLPSEDNPGVFASQKEILCAVRDRLRSLVTLDELHSYCRRVADSKDHQYVVLSPVGSEVALGRRGQSSGIACSPKFLQYPVGYSLHQRGRPAGSNRSVKLPSIPGLSSAVITSINASRDSSVCRSRSIF